MKISLCAVIGWSVVAGTALSVGMGPAEAAGKKDRRIVIVAGKPSHPTMMHEFNAGSALLKKCLDKVKGIEVVLHTNGWPSDPNAFEGADAIFLYMDGGSGHEALKGDRLQLLDALMKKGVGLGCAHFAVEVPADKGSSEWKEWIGGHYEHMYSVNPIWEPDFQTFPKHPVTRGVKPFQVKDEWYFNMRFRPDMKGITPILVAKPSDKVRKGPYVYPQGPYDHILAASGRDEAMMWCTERADGGRGFGFTGGHFHVNWGDDNFRKVVLNALLWIAKAEVPRNGVESTVTPEELYSNLDDKPGRPTGPPKP
jgi:type 1 glutamine amidotransferase